MKVIEPGLRGMRQQGFDKVPLFDIAKDLGVTHAPLYTHFADRSALLDAITERWLNETSIVLDDVCRSRKTPLKKIEERFVAIYQMKRDHMLVDPEPYRAFDLAASLEIHFVVEHIRRLMTQLEQMLEEADLGHGSYPFKRAAEVLFAGTAAFHHPKLVMQAATLNREPLLRKIVQSLLKGLQK